MPLYSHSRLSTFEQCRLKFKYTYLDRLPREEESIEAFVGQRFHEAMEKLYGELAFRVATADELKVFFDAQWEKNFGPHVHIVKRGREPEGYRAIGLKAIDDYCRRYAPYDDARTLGVERRLIVDLDDSGERRVQCYLDRIAARPDGVIEIHDYKTSASLPTQAQLDRDRQLGLYEIAVRSAWPDTRDVELVWHYVAFDREMRSRRTPEELARLRESTAVLIGEVERCEEFPPTESALCPYCSFQDICPLFAHLFREAGIPEEPATLDDGAAIVDRFTELEAKKRELRVAVQAIADEEETLKAAAIVVAEREKATRLFGRDHKLTIRSDLTIHYPKHGEEGRHAFEKEMKAAGLWDRCADINYMTFHGIAKRERWLTAVPPPLAAFVTVEPQKKVTLSKRADVEEDEGGSGHA